MAPAAPNLDPAQQPNPPLVIYHPRDPHTDAAVGPLTDMSSMGLLSDLIIVQAPAEDALAIQGMQAWVVSNGEGEEKPVDDALADAIAADRPLLVIAAASCALPPAHQDALAAAAGRVAALCDRLLPHAATRCSLFFPEFPESDEAEATPVSSAFFAADTVNLIAIPLDSDDDDRMGQRVTAHNADAFSWHVAVELATAAGAWRCVGEGLHLGAQSPGVVGESLVRFLSSRVVTVRLLEGSPNTPLGELPIPEHMAALKRPPAANEMANHLVPQSLVRPPQKVGTDTATDVLTVSEAFRLLPHAISRSWSRRHIAERMESATDARMRDVGLDQPIGGLPERLAGVDPAVCESISSAVCGLIDGGGHDNATHGHLIGPHMTIPSRPYYTRDGLVEKMVTDVGAAVAASSTDGSSAAGDDDSLGDDPASSDQPDAGAEVEAEAEGSAAEGGGQQAEGAEAPGSETADSEDAEAAGSKQKASRAGADGGVRRVSWRKSKPAPSLFLLETVSKTLGHHAAKCRDEARWLRHHVRKSSKAMRERSASHEPPQAMFQLFSVALAVICFALMAFTPLYRVTDMSRWPRFDSPHPTEGVFVTSMAIVAVWLLLALRPSDPSAAMGYKAMVPSLVSVGVALFWVFGDEPVWTEDHALSAVSLMSLLWLAVLFSKPTLKKLGRSRLRERERALTVSLWWAVCCGALAYNFEKAETPRSFVHLIWTLFPALVLLASVAYALIRNLHQARQSINEWWARTDADLANADLWADKASQLAAVQVKWVGAAAALDYLIRNARRHDDDSSSDKGKGSHPENEPPMVRRLEVSESWTSPPQPMRGWLMARHRQAAAAYHDATGFNPLALNDTVRPLPEMDAWRNNRSEPQLDFADKLRSGAFDDIVCAVGEAAPARLDKETAAALAALQPRPEAAEMPVGFLGGSARARVTPLGVERYIWWRPDAIEPGAADSEGLLARRAAPPRRQPGKATVTIWQSVRASISEPVLLSDIGWAVQGGDDDETEAGSAPPAAGQPFDCF